MGGSAGHSIQHLASTPLSRGEWSPGIPQNRVQGANREDKNAGRPGWAQIGERINKVRREGEGRQRERDPQSWSVGATKRGRKYIKASSSND